MSKFYEHCIDPGAHEFAVTSACYDLHMFLLTDKTVRTALQNPGSIKELKRARNQLDSIIRKLEIAPVVERVNREARQADMQKVEA